MTKMRTLLAQLAAAVLLLGCGGATPSPTALPSPVPTVAATHFASAEGGFQVTGPAALTEAVDLVEADFGSLEVHYFQGESEGISYSVVYADYPQTFVGLDPDSFLSSVRNEQVAATGGVLVSEDRVTAYGVEGREFQISAISDKGDKVTYRTRLYWSPTRLYQVSVLAPDGRADDAVVVDYLESFLLTDRAY